MQLFLLFLLLVLTSCSIHKEEKPKGITNSSSPVILESAKKFTEDTLVQNGDSLVLFRINDQPRGLITISGDTIITEANYYQSITFPDIERRI